MAVIIAVLMVFMTVSTVALGDLFENERPQMLFAAVADNSHPLGLTMDETMPQCGSPEMQHIGNFSLYDYSILIGMLVISLGIGNIFINGIWLFLNFLHIYYFYKRVGVFYGFFNKSSSNSSSDFLQGTGMTLLPVTLSLTTSFITAIELLGNPAEMFFNGTQFSLIGTYYKIWLRY